MRSAPVHQSRATQAHRDLAEGARDVRGHHRQPVVPLFLAQQDRCFARRHSLESCGIWKAATLRPKHHRRPACSTRLTRSLTSPSFHEPHAEGPVAFESLVRACNSQSRASPTWLATKAMVAGSPRCDASHIRKQKMVFDHRNDDVSVWLREPESRTNR